MAALYRLPDREGFERLLPVEWPEETPFGMERHPTDPVPAVDGSGKVRIFRWGFVPAWAKSRPNGPGFINARAETATEKATFRQAFRKRRCVLPAAEFYEYRSEPASTRPEQPELFDDAPKPSRAAPKRKRRYRFEDEAGEFLIAGIWETWSAEGEEELHTCAVLTVASNAVVRPFNERMPCLLRAEDVDAWLDARLTSEERLAEILSGAPSERLRVARA